MKPLVEKVLASGLVDQATAQMMEHWGYLPEGASEKVNEGALVNATKEKLIEVADALAVEVEKEHALRETYLDLERLRWPVEVSLVDPKTSKQVAYGLPAVVDRMGRYYFRIQDVKEEWFVPGFEVKRFAPKSEDPNLRITKVEMIIQSQVLYIGDQGVCIQVTTQA